MAFVQMSDVPLFTDRCAMGIAGGNAQTLVASLQGEIIRHVLDVTRPTRLATAD